jgi:multiple sugar transport system substrate-binding protein
MSAVVSLRGITWDHSRGYSPMVATAQRFAELHPGIRIVWEKRSLQAFEAFPVEKLAPDFDLIVLDHPFMGHAARHGPLLPLDQHVPPEFLPERSRNSVGASHASYLFGGHQWALAIDAAAPVAFWREDLLAGLGRSPPATWEEAADLARLGAVEIPAAPINCLMNFYAVCLALGETPFAGRERVVGTEVGRAALARLRELLAHCDPGCWTRNPIASHDLVAGAGNRRVVYCPFAYGYSNYARAGYAPHLLAFGEPPRLGAAPLRTTLGGTGLAVSALRPHRPEAVAYAQFVASAAVQRTIYAHAGGQPADRGAWQDEENNRLAHDYFRRTLPVLERAYLRPRYHGHVEFQEHGGPLIQSALRGTLADREALARLDALYRRTAEAAASSA